jgi:hypothetical protein
MASQPPSSALVGHSRFSSIGPDVPQNLLLKPHMPQQPTKAFNPAGFVNTRSNLPVILNTYHDAPVPLKSQYSMNGQHQESGSQFANSVSQPQPQPQQQQQQRQQQQQQLALAPNNPGIYPSTSQAQGQGMQTRAGLRSAPLRTPGVTPRATPEPPQTRKVSCLHCHSFWWDETCDNNEPCANCVATTAGNAAHACERPKCKNYNDPENCVHKDRCKRAHNTDNYVNLANYQQILRRKFVKKEAVNHPSPALGGNSTTMAGANARTQREGTTTKDAETGAMME